MASSASCFGRPSSGWRRGRRCVAARAGRSCAPHRHTAPPYGPATRPQLTLCPSFQFKWIDSENCSGLNVTHTTEEERALWAQTPHMEAWVEGGDCIFIPEGWYHQVRIQCCAGRFPHRGATRPGSFFRFAIDFLDGGTFPALLPRSSTRSRRALATFLPFPFLPACFSAESHPPAPYSPQSGGIGRPQPCRQLLVGVL